MPKKNTLLFLALISISFALMTYQSKKGHLLNDNLIRDIINRSHSITQSLSDAVKSPFKKIALREEENRLLKKLIDELLLERAEYPEVLLENRRLRALLELRETRRNYVAAAEVIARGMDIWKKTLLLDKGKMHGVLKDMAVITPDGLAGKIISVTDAYSQMLLVTDLNFSAAVRLQKTRTEGILSGTGKSNCILKYVKFDDEVNSGDIVVTSGVDAFFPSGIPVGFVSEIEKKDPQGHFQSIEVIPFQNDATIEEVIIVK